MSTWADVVKGDRIKLGSRVLVVDKAKRKGKKVRIVVHDKLGTFDREVKAKDAVDIVPNYQKPEGGLDFGRMLHDRHGAQQRWAGDAEQQADEPKRGPHHGSPWETPADKTEKTLQQVLGATLVEESIDGGRTYAVPPVDVSTVAAHWLIMHGGDPTMLSEQELATHHKLEHEQHKPASMKVPHYHSETRP